MQAVHTENALWYAINMLFYNISVNYWLPSSAHISRVYTQIT